MVKKLKILCLAVFISASASAKVDTTIVGTIMAGVTKNMFVGQLKDAAQISIRNAGTADLEICFGASPTTQCVSTNGIMVPGGQTVTTTVAELSRTARELYVNITNLSVDPSKLSSYIVTLLVNGPGGGTNPPQPPTVPTCDLLNTVWFSDITKKQTYVCPKDSKVGIGDEGHGRPYRMHIYGATSSYTPLTIDYNSSGSATGYAFKINLNFNGYAYLPFQVARYTTSTQFSSYAFDMRGTGETIFSGNLYIGTKGLIPTGAAEYKCMVNGGIRAKDVVITTSNWPDYVFEKNYKLKPLQVLEKETLAQKHLPEIASSAAIETSGIQASQMLQLQMKKIEELTLYLIQQDKQIDQQIKEIAQLKNTKQCKSKK